MPMVNVSEKTLSELKEIKEGEELKSLDGAIRHLFKPPTNQTEFESTGPWPLNSITDINTARSTLQRTFKCFTDYYLVGPPRIIKALDSQLAGTDITFRMFILSNKLIAGVIEQKHDEECAVLIGYHVKFVDGLNVALEKSLVKILNIERRWPPPPSELTDEELLERLEGNYSTPVLSEAVKRLLRLSPTTASDEK